MLPRLPVGHIPRSGGGGVVSGQSVASAAAGRSGRHGKPWIVAGLLPGSPHWHQQCTL